MDRLMRLGLLSFVLLSSCFNVGNDLGGTCKRGDTCVCDLIGNCTKSCPDGNCHFICKGTSNCILDCDGGGCDAICENTGNCLLSCEGGNCDIKCNGTGNCILKDTPDLSVVPPDLSVPRDLRMSIQD